MIKTTQNTIKSLSTNLINHLVKQGHVELNDSLRTNLVKDLESLFLKYVKSQEDIDRGIDVSRLKEMSNTMSPEEMENIASQYQTDSLKENSHNGLYYLTSIRNLTFKIKDLLYHNQGVDEIFADDNTLINDSLQFIRKFDTKNISY